MNFPSLRQEKLGIIEDPQSSSTMEAWHFKSNRDGARWCWDPLYLANLKPNMFHGFPVKPWVFFKFETLGLPLNEMKVPIEMKAF